MKFDADDLHFVSQVPSWAKGTENLKFPCWVSSKTYRHLHDKVMKANRAQRSRRRRWPAINWAVRALRVPVNMELDDRPLQAAPRVTEESTQTTERSGGESREE